MIGENIYEDLDDFALEHRLEQVQANNEELQETIVKLEETTKKFNDEITDLKKINHNLERNISALFKTAKCEIERKNKKITELQNEVDNLKFKRINKKGPKPVDNDPVLLKEIEKSKCVIEQKNRIIQSLTKELEYVKKDFSIQEKNLKRKLLRTESDDLRNKLGKKMKLDDKFEYKRDSVRGPRTPPSKSKDSRYKSHFDKKRTLRRHRSGSFEERRSSIIEKHKNSKYNNSKYSRSRSRSPIPNKKYNDRVKNPPEPPPPLPQESIRRSRSSSIDRSKKHSDTKQMHSHLIKEDSGMSSSNSHTSELILKPDNRLAAPVEQLKADDLEEGEIDCSLEDIESDVDIFFKQNVNKLNKENTRKTSKTKESHHKKETKKLKDENAEGETKTEVQKKTTEIQLDLDRNKKQTTNEIIFDKDDVLELMVQKNCLDDLDIDEEISKMRMFEDDKRKKRKEDKERISKLRTAISECKQNIELLEHNISSEDETEAEDDFSKTASFLLQENVQKNNLVLKISKGSIVKPDDKPKTVNLKPIEIQKIEDVLDKININKEIIVKEIKNPQIEENKKTEEISDVNKKEVIDKETIKPEKCEKIKTNDKVDTIKSKQKEPEKCRKTENVDLKNKLEESIVKEIVNDAKIADVTNLDSTKNKNSNDNILNIENERKENFSQNEQTSISIVNKDNNIVNETERKPPLKARRRRAFICIT